MLNFQRYSLKCVHVAVVCCCRNSEGGCPPETVPPKLSARHPSAAPGPRPAAPAQGSQKPPSPSIRPPPRRSHPPARRRHRRPRRRRSGFAIGVVTFWWKVTGGLGAGMLGPEKQKHTFLVGFFVGPAHAQGIVKRTGSKKIGWPVVSCGQPLPNRTATGDDRPKFARLFEGVGFNFRVCKHLRPSRSTFLHWSLQGTQRTQRTVRQW